MATMWAVDDIDQSKFPDLMAIVSHGATSVGPTLGSKSVTLAAVGFQDALLKTDGHRPSVYFGIFTLSFKPNIERTYKSSLFSLFGIDVGDVINTIGECKAIKKKYGVTINFSGPAKHILLVTDQAHSRRAQIVWKAYFKGATVRILAVSPKVCHRSEQPDVDLSCRMASFARKCNFNSPILAGKQIWRTRT